MWRNALLISILATWTAAGAFGACLESVLKDLNAQAERGFLSQSDRQAIAGAWSEAGRTPAEKAKQAYKIAFEARLRALPPDEADTIRRIAARRTRNVKPMLDAQYHPIERRLILDLPEEYFDALPEYFQMKHEVAHAIQDLAVATKTKVNVELLFTETRNTDSYLRHLMEKGAVTEEYELLASIPKEERLRLIREMGQTTYLDQDSSRFLARALRNSFLDRKTYVARELSRRHYELSFQTRLNAEILPSIQASHSYNWVLMNPKKTAAIAVSLFSASSLAFACGQMSASPAPQIRELALYRRLCPRSGRD